MTKVLYIPNGQYLIFHVSVNVSTSIYEESLFCKAHISLDDFMSHIYKTYTLPSFKKMNELPLFVTLHPCEFEIIL